MLSGSQTLWLVTPVDKTIFACEPYVNVANPLSTSFAHDFKNKYRAPTGYIGKIKHT